VSLYYREDICTCHGKKRRIVKRLPGRMYCHEGNQERLDERRQKDVREGTRKRPKRLKRYTHPTGEKALFDSMLASRPNVSFVSGKRLTDWDREGYKCCMHVLAKGGYPRFRLYEKNIVFGTAEEHRLFDQGTEKERQEYQTRTPGCDWGKLYRLKDEIRKEYETGK